MARSLRRTMLLAGAAALAACFSPHEPDARAAKVRFTVARDAYAPGDTVSAALENASLAALGYNLCPTELQRQEGSRWVESEEQLILCVDEMDTLPPGGRAEYRRALSPGLAEGPYRFETLVEVTGSGTRIPVRSAAFRVRR